MINYTIYSYWNITELAGVFNAVSALVYSDNYSGALKFIALVGVLSLSMTVLAGKGKMEEFWQWTLMVALLNGLLLAPRATVQLVDQTGTNPTVVVANVPIGLAAVAGSVSTIGYWLTTSYETVFALPNSLNFEVGGMMFGQKVQQEMNNLKPATIAWTNDFNTFYTECLAPDILNNTLTLDQINASNNIWSLLGATNPGLYVTLSTVGTVTCPAAYTDLTTRLTTSEVPASLQNYATTALPQTSSSALAVTQVGQVMVDSSSYFNGIATSANAAVQQAIVSNSIIDAHCNMLSQTTNTALANECMTQSEGFRQTNTAYMAMANISQSSMPKLHNAIELIQYAIFPIILIFIIVAGHHGMTVLKTYVMSLMWIQLWPPLYAVVNYMMNVHATYWANATQGNAMAMQMQQWISQTSVSDQAIAGMLTIAIPGIAAALVKGGDVGMQAVGNLASPPASVEKMAAQMSMGNHNSGQMNEAPGVTTGGPTQTNVNQDGTKSLTFGDRSKSFDVGAAAINSVAKIESGSSYGSKLETSSADAVTSSNTNSQQSTAAMQSVLGNIQTLAQTSGKGDVAATADNKTHMATITKANQTIESSVKSLMDKTGVTQGEATEIVAAATAGTPGAGLLGSSASVTLSGKETASRQKIAEEANSIVKTNNLATLVADASNASHALSFTSQRSAGAEAAKQVQAGLTSSQNFQNTAKSDLARSEELSHKAAIARSLDVGSKEDVTKQVFDRVIDQAAHKGITIGGHTYKNDLTYEKINAELMGGSQEMRSTLDKAAENMYSEKINGMVNGKEPHAEGRAMLTADQVKQDHVDNNSAQPGSSAVDSHHLAAIKTEGAAEKQAGVKVGNSPKNTVGAGVSTALADAGKQTAGTPAVETPAAQNADVAALTGQVKKAEDVSLPAAVLENAGHAVMGDSAAYLADKVIPGQASGTFFNDGAQNFNNSFPGRSDGEKTGIAIVETVVDVAVMVGSGGLGGKLAEKTAEKGAAALAEDAAATAATKVGTDAALDTAKQGVASGEVNLVARQAEKDAAQSKLDTSNAGRWPQSNTAAQQQLNQDRQALTTAKSNVADAERGLVDAKQTMEPVQKVATGASDAASDSKILADKARRGVADQKISGQVFGAEAGNEVDQVANNAINDNRRNQTNSSVAPAQQAEAPKAEPAPAHQPNDLTDSPGKSNLGNLFGGGKAYVPPNQRTEKGEGSKNGDIPPPRS
jgi:conjugal transfer mating pair stabilization protein TraG